MKTGDLVKYSDYKMFILDDINYINQKTVKQVFKNGAIEITKEYSPKEHSYLIDLIDKSGRLNKKLSEKEIQAVASYFITLSPLRAMQLWTTIGNGEIKNTVALHQCKVKKQSASEHIVAIVSADSYSGLPGGSNVNRDQVGVVISHVDPTEHNSEINRYQIYWADQTKTEVLDAWMEVVSENR